MCFAHAIQSRNGRVWAILTTLALIAVLIAAVVLLSRQSPKPFDVDDWYGVLD
jgi:hypothetical protein